MKEVAKLYNVELGEKFNLKDYKGEDLPYNPHCFSEKGLVDRDGDFIPEAMRDLLTGDLTLEKIPFKPFRGEWYVYVASNGRVGKSRWLNWDTDFYRYNAGNCFNSENDISDKIKERILKEMKEK